MGNRRFFGDLKAPGALWLVFVRSVHAHARILAIDISAATSFICGTIIGAGAGRADQRRLRCAQPVRHRNQRIAAPPQQVLASHPGGRTGDPNTIAKHSAFRPIVLPLRAIRKLSA